MDDKPLQLIPVSKEQGQVVVGPTGLRVNVKGGIKDAVWTSGYNPRAGDNVEVLSVDTTAIVLGPVLPGPPPGFGVVSVTAADGILTVLGDDQVLYPCRYAEPPQTVGTRVALLWQGTQAFVLPGTLAAIASDPLAPGPPTPPPPPANASGVLGVPALWAGSWRPFGWEAGDVRQGAYGSSPSNRGAWFYGGQATQLQGRVVTGIRMYVGPRARVGSYNSALTAHFFATTGNSPHDWTPVTGAFDITFPAGWGGGWVDLPHGWGSHLLNGGGIGIQGSPYMGFAGGTPSGQLEISWRSS